MLTKKITQFILLSLSLLCLIALNVHAATVTTKGHVTVHGEMVKLSDLFAGIPAEIDRGIAASPQPGQQMVFNGQILTLLAKRFELTWMPVQQDVKVTVERASNKVKEADILAKIKETLVKQGFGADLDVMIDNRLTNIYLDVTQQPTLAVDHFNLDPATQRYTASLSTPANSPNAQTFTVFGRAYKLVKVPVLNKRVANGNVIKAHDIKWIEKRETDVSKNIILNPENLIGKTPRRFMAEGDMIREDSVMLPLIVKKGNMVVMSLTNEFMTITMRGQAQEDGALGDIVRVMNTKSNQVIHGEVIGADRVKVQTAPKLAAR